MNIKKIVSNATDGLLNDSFRQSFLVMVLSALLAIIIGISAVTHLISDEEKLFGIISMIAFGIATAIFLLTLFLNKYRAVWRRIFMAAIVLFFGYLCYDGGPDGFLHIWILLIPAFSFITFGLGEGFITAVPVFLTMIAFFWWPLADFRKYAAEQASFNVIDQQVATFSTNFRLRITLLYIVCVFLGFFAELVRNVAAKRLRKYTDNFKYASMHDTLTGLANQNYLAKYLDDIYAKKNEGTSLGCLFVDVDSFKNVNDTYGHLFGNVVLVRIGEKYRAAVSAVTFEEKPHFHITISVGAIVMKVDDSFNFNHVLELADSANRRAKNKGKDNVTLVD